MARTNQIKVKKIIATDLDDLTPFIDTANSLVTAKLGSSTLSDTVLEQIEMWLSAHLVAVRDQVPMEERIGEASVKYFGKTGLGLDATMYGQTVKLLDTTGILLDLGKRSVSINVTGPYDE
jgi:hypothetical protein